MHTDVSGRRLPLDPCCSSLTARMILFNLGGSDQNLNSHVLGTTFPSRVEILRYRGGDKVRCSCPSSSTDADSASGQLARSPPRGQAGQRVSARLKERLSLPEREALCWRQQTLQARPPPVHARAWRMKWYKPGRRSNTCTVSRLMGWQLAETSFRADLSLTRSLAAHGIRHCKPLVVAPFSRPP